MNWLRYYKANIGVALVLACIIGLVLLGVLGLSPAPAIFTGTTIALVATGLLTWLQRSLTARSIHPIRVESHTGLGRVSVYRNHWQTELQALGLPNPCTLSGRSSTGEPTVQQIALWRAICEQGQSLLDVAFRSLSSQVSSATSALGRADLRLTVLLLAENGFVLFLLYPMHLDPKQRGFFARFQDMNLVEAGRTPWKEKNGWFEV